VHAHAGRRGQHEEGGVGETLVEAPGFAGMFAELAMVATTDHAGFTATWGWQEDIAGSTRTRHSRVENNGGIANLRWGNNDTNIYAAQRYNLQTRDTTVHKVQLQRYR
jgi:hypothetical protein